MKTCFKCALDTPGTTEFFYAHPGMSDGLLGKCKECSKKDAARRAIDRKDYILNYEHGRASLKHRVMARKAYLKTSAGAATRQRSISKYRLSNPDRYRAHNAVNNAIRNGSVTRKPCERCGNKKVEGHHDDYSKPLEVRWLCNKHHRERDKEIRMSNAGRST